MAARRRPGPPLPYRLIGGAVPCPGGWLLVAGRLQGIQVAVLEPQLLEGFLELLDHRPGFDVLAVHCHLSFPREQVPGGRRCDQEARALLGWPRSGAITSAPSRELLRDLGPGATSAPGLSPISAGMLQRYAEVAEHLQPYHQRQVVEVHPELSFFQLNDDRPMQHPKESPEGVLERRELLRARMPHLDHVLDAAVPGARQRHVLDAVAALVTARRVAARAVVRIPEEPQWDDEGVRMELVR